MKLFRSTTYRCGLLALSAGLSLGALARPAHAITDQQEIEAGRQMAQQAIKEYGQPLPASDPRQQRVSRIGAMFARQAQRRNIPFTYTVLQNDKVLNAFAGPGGPVFVTTKLIATAQNDAELAYVLGHETGHIEYKHVVKGAEASQRAAIVAGIGGAILGQVLGGGRNADVVAGLAGTTAGLWQKGFSRKEESQADDYGVHAMARLGFDPRAAISMLGRLGDGPEGLAKYLSDHPTGQARQRAVGAAIQNDHLVAVAQSNGGPFLALNGGRENQGSLDVSNQDASQSTQEGASLAPFRARIVGGVVMAPAVAMAQFAGGQWRTGSDAVEVRARGASGTFRVGSTDATLLGRSAVLSSAPRNINGQLYAPVGALSAALGGRAALDARANSVRITWNDGGTSVLRY